jgi:hypothetical protein
VTGEQLSTNHRGNNSFYVILAFPVPHTVDVLSSQEASFFFKKKETHTACIVETLFVVPDNHCSPPTI